MKRFAMKAVGIVVVVLALVVVSMPVSTRAQAPEKIVVAYIGPLTGPAAPWGLGTMRGGQYFLDQANAKGGVKVAGKSYTFEYLSYDHQLDTTKAMEFAKRAIFTDKVKVLALQSTMCVLPILPMITENKIMNFHYTAGSKIMSPDFRYGFRGVFASTFAETAAYEHAKAKLGLNTVVSIHSDDEAGWEGFKDAQFASATTGLKLIGSEYYVRGTKDFYPILSRVLAKKPDAISFGLSSPGDCYLITKQAYELGFKGLVTGGAPLDIVQLKKTVPEKALDQVVIVIGGTPDIPEYMNPEEQEMKRAMIEKYGRGGQLWDVGMENIFFECQWSSIYIQAIQKADSLDPEKVTKVIETSKFRVLGRELRFGGKKQYGIGHQIIVDVPILKIVDGAPKVVGIHKASAED